MHLVVDMHIDTYSTWSDRVKYLLAAFYPAPLQCYPLQIELWHIWKHPLAAPLSTVFHTKRLAEAVVF